jgi:hypothetical protein
MQSVGHIHAFPPIGIDREVDDVSGLLADFYQIQNVGERHADPLGDVRPAFFTREFRDLAAGREAFELGQRKRGGSSDIAKPVQITKVNKRKITNR